MQEHVGSEFDGLITGVTSFGVFVVLNSMYAEGLVHVTSLPKDYYHFDPAGHSLTGERSGRVYRPGDPLRVRVTRVDIDERKIDFDPASEPEKGGGAGSRKKKAGAGDRKAKDAGAKPAGKKRSGRKRSGKKRSSRGGSGRGAGGAADK